MIIFIDFPPESIRFKYWSRASNLMDIWVAVARGFSYRTNIPKQINNSYETLLKQDNFKLVIP